MSQILLDSPPPSDETAERAVLGALLYDNKSLYEIDMKAEYMYLMKHKLIFLAIYTLIVNSGHADIITVSEELKKNGSDTGGAHYLTELYESVVSSASIKHHAKIVKDKWQAREILCKLVEAQGKVNHESPDDIIGKTIDNLLGISNESERDFVSAKEVQLKVNEYIDRRHEGIHGISTTIDKIDQKTDGLEAGNLVIIAGRPSRGKSSLAVQMANAYAIKSGETVLFFSLEMTAEELGLKMLSQTSGVPNWKIKHGKLDTTEYHKVHESQNQLVNTKFLIDDSGAIKVDYVLKKTKQATMKGKVGLVVIDYLQLMATDESGSRHLDLGRITSRLKGMAKNFHLPVVLLSQLSRDVEIKGRRPQLSDLLESGRIEADADKVIFIHAPNFNKHEESNEMEMELIVGKSRGGATGVCNATFIRDRTLFVDGMTNLEQGEI